MERVVDVAKPFYERALTSTRTKLDSGAVNPDMLSRARATVGIEEEMAKEMHIEAFAKEIRVQLGLPEVEEENDEEEAEEEGKAVEKKAVDTSGIKFKEGAFEHVSLFSMVASTENTVFDIRM